MTGTDHDKTKPGTLPQVLITNLCGTDRETVTATGQNSLHNATLLLETQNAMQVQIDLQNPDHHDRLAPTA